MTPNPDPRRRRYRTEWVALASMLLLVAVILGWTVYDEHRRVWLQEGERLQVQARVIDENVLRQLQGARAALEGVANELANGDPGEAIGLDGKLKLLTDSMPGISSMLVLDAGGYVVASSRAPLLGKNFYQREYFDAPRRGMDPSTLYVSPPFASSLGTFVIVVSRPLVDAEGRFKGVATATLDPEYFGFVLRSVLYAPDMRGALIHGDGKVFLNVPHDSEALGTDLSRSDTLFTRHRRSGAMATLQDGRVLAVGDERLIAIRDIQGTGLRMHSPLVVAVGRELGAMYAPWRARVLQYALLWLLLALGTSTALTLNQRRRQAIGSAAAEIARERQEASDRVELALRGADLGLWDLHLPDHRCVVNPRERALLGYALDEDLAQGLPWREHVHPDDRARVQAAIVPHLSGQAANYECEHRMRRKDGSYLWVLARGMIVARDADGAPLRVVGTHLDITGQKRTQAELALAAARVRDSEAQLRAVADNMPALVSRFDTQQRLCFVNRAYQDWLGIDPAALLGRTLREVYGDVDYMAFSHHIQAALDGKRRVYERELHAPRGTRRVEVTLVPQVNDSGAVDGVYALIVDITARHEAQARLRRLAEFDSLTGLPNRLLFQDRVAVAMRRAVPGRSMALLFIDVDHFKTINDTLGHECGDRLLQVYARRMQDAVRPSDTVARLGGDEFTVILEGLRESGDAVGVAANLVEVLREPVVLDGCQHVVTASIGLALGICGESDDAALLRRADAALYEAKRRGRNGYYCESEPSRALSLVPS